VPTQVAEKKQKELKPKLGSRHQRQWGSSAGELGIKIKGKAHIKMKCLCGRVNVGGWKKQEE